MLGIIKDFKKIYSELKNGSVEFDLSCYKIYLNEIRKIDLTGLTNIEIEERAKSLGSNIKKLNGNLKAFLPETYALVCEAVKRTLGITPFDVQLLAGIAMNENKLAEMHTGEGKTLTAVFPACLNALNGKGVHILTFNDYLAKRDAQWMGPVYRFLGLSVGYVREGMSIEERKRAYSCDVTYITAKEAGFDYLRDSLCFDEIERVQRNLNFAIIDEADSILIDEARIPLVIAAGIPSEAGLSKQMAAIVKELKSGRDYCLDEYGRNVNLTEIGVEKVEKLLECGNLYEGHNIQLLTAVNGALHAEALLKRDVDYIVRDGKLEQIDEFTGRIAEKRHWPDGLQSALEAKEGIDVNTNGRILGSITIHNFIKLYKSLCGMTATARTSAEELKEFYDLEVVVIPTNKPCIRIDYPDTVYSKVQDKINAVINEVERVHASGRPILIGTASVEQSELLAVLLREKGINCEVLNAKNDELEAQIISKAGEFFAVTVSTNMAGRGTDIKLGGREEKDRDRVVEIGGLYVIGINRHESRRVDNQLRGRAGRQGDPGSTRFFISFEDELFTKYGIDRVMPDELMNLKTGEPINSKIANQRINHIQKLIEGQNCDTRRTLSKYSFILEEQRKIISKRRLLVNVSDNYLELLSSICHEKYTEIENKSGKAVLKNIARYITLFYIDKCWADHLEYATYIQDGIHLVSICGKNPLDEFHKSVISSFSNINELIDREITDTFSKITVTASGIDLGKEGIKRPASTWTYLISDDYFINNLGTYLISPGNSGFSSVAAMLSWPVMIATLMYERFFKNRK